MKPLLFLTTRSVFNGIKRSVTSGRRLIGLLFFISYYAWIMRPSMFGSSNSKGNAFPTDFKMEFPALRVIEAVLFAGFVIGTAFLALSAVSTKNTFKPADVDVLFPTPMSPKIVLAFRMLRDSLVSVIVPLIFGVIFFRSASAGWTGMFKNLPHPESSGLVLRASILAWLLASFAWVAIGVAWSLYFNRPFDRIDAQRSKASWAIGLVSLAIVTFITLKLRASNGGEDLLQLAENPMLRCVFFLATACTKLAMAPLEASVFHAVLGLGGLVLVIVGAVSLAMRQAGWLYELSATQTSKMTETVMLQRRGDLYGIVAHQARLGKFKVGKASWINKVRVVGPRALLWKEYIIQSRASRFTLLLFSLITVALSIMPALLGSAKSDRAEGLMTLIFILMMVFVATASTANAGFLEMLRRGDLQKPLPFTPARTVFYEIAGKAFLGTVCAIAGGVASLIAMPATWQTSVAALILMPAIALLLSAAFCVIIVLFPDVEDPTQRGFRSLMTMLGIILFCGPSAALYALLMFLKVSPILAAIPTALLNVGVAAAAASLAGGLYASFNPSE